jgi:hypothetical protein
MIVWYSYHTHSIDHRGTPSAPGTPETQATLFTLLGRVVTLISNDEFKEKYLALDDSAGIFIRFITCLLSGITRQNKQLKCFCIFSNNVTYIGHFTAFLALILFR